MNVINLKKYCFKFQRRCDDHISNDKPAIENEKKSKNRTLEEMIIIKKNKLLRFIRERNDYIRNLPETEKKAFIASIQDLKESKDKIEKLLLKEEVKKLG